MIRWGPMVLVLLTPLHGHAQVVPERELEIAKALFDAGNYQDALKRAADAMAVANFTDEQRLELHRIAGLSAFNAAAPQAAQKHFFQLLQINPDFVLDPFAAPPPAIKLFEQVRRQNADALNLVRQQLALRAQQEKRNTEERERARIEQEAARRKVEELTRSTTVRVIDKHPFLLNFVPFGAGQFQQGRVAWGMTFAVLEAVTGLTSLISYLAIESLFVTDTVIVLRNVLTSTGDTDYSVKLRHLPQQSRAQAARWSAVKISSGIAFYALWALGIGDAIWHHQGETISEHQEAPLAPKLTLSLTPGGLGAGFSFSF